MYKSNYLRNDLIFELQYVHYEIDPNDVTTAEAREAAGAYNRGQLRPDTLDKRKSDLSLEKSAPTKADVPLYPPQVLSCLSKYNSHFYFY